MNGDQRFVCAGDGMVNNGRRVAQVCEMMLSIILAEIFAIRKCTIDGNFPFISCGDFPVEMQVGQYG